MKLFFSLFFLFFYFLPFQSQAQMLMNYRVYQNMDQFNWLDFIKEENIQKHIDFMNETFEDLGVKSFTITRLNVDKLLLLRIEQELGLYKAGIKTGLSSEVMRSVEEAIHRHWNNIINIEQQIQAQAGFDVATPELTLKMSLGFEPRLHPWSLAYRNGVKELYKGDHEVLFNIVEKKDQNLYNSLGRNDELFAQFALPQVERYVQKLENTAGAFHRYVSSLDQNSEPRLDRDIVNTLFFMYRDSLEMYNCFLKNFPNPVGENQQKLKRVIEGRHEQQSKWGAEALMTAYQYGIEDNPWSVARSLHNFQTAPLGVKTEIGEFYRNEFLNNPDFINTNDLNKQGARVDALIGLKYLGLLEEGSEVELFDRAVEEGVIRSLGENSFSGCP